MTSGMGKLGGKGTSSARLVAPNEQTLAGVGGRSLQCQLLTRLCKGQHATVLQLPAFPRVRSQAEENKQGSLVA